MRLIDADKLRERMYHDAFEVDSDLQKWDAGCWIRYRMFENAIDDVPTIDAELVRHGKWIMDWTRAEYCSECGEYPFDDGMHHIAGWHSDYCPHCGAKMSPWHEQLIYQNEVKE